MPKTDKSDRTKQLLADSLRELARTKPLAQITVADITDNCGLSRAAFYYHFEDKQQLANWIYQQARQHAVQITDEAHLLGNLNQLTRNMFEDYPFYAQAAKVYERNEFMDYYFRTCCDCFIRLFKAHLGDRYDLIDPADAEYLARYFTHAGIDMSVEWFRSMTGENASEYDLQRFERLNGLTDAVFRHGLYGTLDRLADRARKDDPTRKGEGAASSPHPMP